MKPSPPHWSVSPALQLWSVRNEMNTDARSTLHAIAAMGYRRVELAGFGNLATPGEVRDAVESAGLTLLATHVPIEFLRSKPDGVLEDTLALGTSRVVCPILPAASFQTLESCREAGREMDGIGAQLRAGGVQLSYHVHGRDEFKLLDGEFALDRMLAECAPGHVELEIDVLWVAHAGISPGDYIRRMGATLIHIKDMTPEGKSTDLGTGILDLPDILGAIGETHAAEDVIIEQEHFTRPPMETAERNLRAFQELISRKTV
ncbi:MAG: sugar phosphate isomerase/epimerase [Verrucomicrobiae bacterium]